MKRLLLLLACCVVLGGVAFAEDCGSRIGFHAHLAGQSQTGYPTVAYVPIYWPGEARDCGDRFDGFSWTPVLEGEPPAWVTFDAQVFVSQYATGAPPIYLLKILKNWTSLPEFSTGVGVAGSYPASFVVQLSTGDLAMPGDTYQIGYYGTSSAAILDGLPKLSWVFGVKH